MGLGDFFGKMAGEAVKKIQYENERYQKMTNKYETFDDDRLWREYRRAKDARDYAKIKATADILKRRGYEKEEY